MTKYWRSILRVIGWSALVIYLLVLYQKIDSISSTVDDINNTVGDIQSNMPG
jgi:hypothetical protein